MNMSDIAAYMTKKMQERGKERTIIIPATQEIEMVRISPGAVAKFYAIRDIYRNMLRESGARSEVEASQEFYTWGVRQRGEDITRDFYLPHQTENTTVRTNFDPLEEALTSDLRQYLEGTDLEVYCWTHIHPWPQSYASVVHPSSTDRENNKRILSWLAGQEGSRLRGYDVTKMPSLKRTLEGEVLELSDETSLNVYRVRLDRSGLSAALQESLGKRGLKADKEKTDAALQEALEHSGLVASLEDHSPVYIAYSKSLIFNCRASPAELAGLFSPESGRTDESHLYGEVFGYLLDSHGRIVQDSYFCQEVPVRVVPVAGDFELTAEGTLAPKYLGALEAEVRKRINLDRRTRRATEVEKAIKEAATPIPIVEPADVMVPVQVEQPIAQYNWSQRFIQRIVSWLNGLLPKQSLSAEPAEKEDED